MDPIERGDLNRIQFWCWVFVGFAIGKASVGAADQDAFTGALCALLVALYLLWRVTKHGVDD